MTMVLIILALFLFARGEAPCESIGFSHSRGDLSLFAILRAEALRSRKNEEPLLAGYLFAC